MVSVYCRVSLRTVSAFRTVSYEAVWIIAQMPPVKHLIEKRSRYYGRRSHISREEEQKITIDQLQQRWVAANSGRWTRRLIPNVGLWYGCQHREVDFYVTLLLTRHGCFRFYQCRFKLDNITECPGCQTGKETVEHVFFTCISLAAERSELDSVWRMYHTRKWLTTW
nr:uncharacterized protein LOC106684671 [Halyomorpha halys]